MLVEGQCRILELDVVTDNMVKIIAAIESADLAGVVLLGTEGWIAANHREAVQLLAMHHRLLRQTRHQVWLLVCLSGARCQKDVAVFFIQNCAIVNVICAD